MIYFVIDAAPFWDDGADKRDVGCWENVQRRRRRRLAPWYNRSSRILAALAAGKVFNAVEGSIRRHKIYGSCWKVDVRMPETVWVPIKASMGTVKSIQRYRKLFLFILGAADGRLAPFWKIHPFEKKRFSHLGIFWYGGGLDMDLRVVVRVVCANLLWYAWLHHWSYHISRIDHLFCTKSSRSIRSMHIFAHGGEGYGYWSTGRGSRGIRELVLVRMVAPLVIPYLMYRILMIWTNHCMEH